MAKTKTQTDQALVFECHAPSAQSVCLAGTFNEWNPEATPMTKAAEDMWRAVVDLPPGRHEFKFVVDGQWCCEPGCEGAYHGCPKCVPNDYGTMNRVIEVEAY